MSKIITFHILKFRQKLPVTIAGVRKHRKYLGTVAICVRCKIVSCGVRAANHQVYTTSRDCCKRVIVKSVCYSTAMDVVSATAVFCIET